MSGEKLVRAEQEVTINYFGTPKDDQQFLIMGVDPPDLLWTSPLPLSQVAVDYIKAVTELPTGPEASLDRLRFYIDYLENEESLLARDAYDEFASAPYGEIKALKSEMDREQLLEWIQDTNLAPDRKRLYLVMLGVCGLKEDAKLLEKLLRSDDPDKRAGLDSMIACYVTLLGADGLGLIDELFLSNEKSQYADTYAAIMALRFHGTDGGIIEKERVLKSMRLILERPALADLVIPDLARWEDWTQIDKLVTLFKEADEKSSWVRVPVINYLRACPLKEAEAALNVVKEIDPKAYKRAETFFLIPQSSTASETDSSSLGDPQRFEFYAESAISTDTPARLNTQAPVAVARDFPNAPLSRMSSPTVNPLSVVSVLSMVSVSLWISMWLCIGGAGNRPLLKILKRRSA